MSQIDDLIVGNSNSDGTVAVIDRTKGDKPYTVPMKKSFLTLHILLPTITSQVTM
jgi:hypothetical protein